MTSNIGDMINSPEMSSRVFEVWDTTTAIIVTVLSPQLQK